MVKDLLDRVPGVNKLASLLGRQPRKEDHREFLLRMLPKRTVGVEIGVHKGDFSARILRTVKPKVLHLVDPWKYEGSDTYKKALYGGIVKDGQTGMDKRYEAVCARFKRGLNSGQVKIYRGDSSDILREFPDGYFDWVYIDGNHLYEFAKKDLDLSFDKVKPGGYITGDDYTEGGWWQGGVKQAVDEFIQEKSVHVIAIRNVQFILQK